MEIKELTSKGIIPYHDDMEKHPEKSVAARPFFIGRVSALIDEVLPAHAIVDSMVSEAARILRENAVKVTVRTKL